MHKHFYVMTKPGQLMVTDGQQMLCDLRQSKSAECGVLQNRWDRLSKRGACTGWQAGEVQIIPVKYA